MDKKTITPPKGHKSDRNHDAEAKLLKAWLPKECTATSIGSPQVVLGKQREFEEVKARLELLVERCEGSSLQLV